MRSYRDTKLKAHAIGATQLYRKICYIRQIKTGSQEVVEIWHTTIFLISA